MNIKNLLIILALFAATAKLVSAERAFKAPIDPTAPIVSSSEHPRVDVVFVLDTTGSMGGLIQAAKQKIWSVANTLAASNSNPEIRVGLVAYRDRGDAYVTKRTALNSDLDAVYSDLMQFQAGGGGDGPESVNQALNEAITDFQWSEEPGTYRAVFLVGDAPPHMDYQDDVKYQQSLQLAKQKGIVVNTIQCGSMHATTPVWQQIASFGEGKFFRVEQSGGAIVASTPYDKQLAKLSRALDDTRMFYGNSAEQKLARKKAEVGGRINAKAPASALASRAVWNASAAGKKTFAGNKELVSDFDDKNVKLDELEEENLPAELRSVPADKREKVVKAKLAKRRDIQEKIDKLSSERQEFLKENAAKGKEKDSFDHAIYDAVKTQASEVGITYEGGPTY